MEDVLSRVAKNIRFYRLKKKMTQVELAKKAGISRGYISRIEHARVNVYLDTLMKLAKGLGVRVMKLVE